MKYANLKKFLELQEQMKLITAEMDSIKDDIKAHFGAHGGESEVDGILFSVAERTRTNTDMTALTAEVGPELVARFQSALVYQVVTVKATSRALKKARTA